MIHTQVNVTETATTDLPTNAVLVTDAQILCKVLDRGKIQEWEKAEKAEKAERDVRL